MMFTLDILDSIEKLTRLYYSEWSIGVTDDPGKSRAEHLNPDSWYYWGTETEQQARKMEKYFLDKGMRSEGLSGKAFYIYIFK